MRYQFGDFILDTDTSKLHQGTTVISDDERIVKTLAVLCQAYPEYANKEELLNEVWPGQVVTDWSLSKIISDIRQLIGDSGKDQEFIKTVRGKGFKLNVVVDELTEEEATLKTNQASPPETRRFQTTYLAVFGVVVLTIIGYLMLDRSPAVETNITYPRQVAVLPVSSSDEQTVNDWVQYGVMTMVAEQLSPYNSLQVIPVSNVISTLGSDDLADLTDTEKFEFVCTKLGCTDLINIDYTVVNKLPTLSYRVIRESDIDTDHPVSSSDVMDATMMLLDDLITNLLPNDREIQAVEKKLTQNTKADREFAMGLHELISGDLQTARNYLQLALDREPDFFWISAYLAEVEYRSGNLELATSMIEQLDAQELTTEQSYFLQHLNSNILYSQGQLDASLATTRALTSNEFALQNPILLGNEYLNIGSSLQASGNNPEAIVALEKANELYQQAGYLSGEGKVLFNLGNVYLTNSQPNEAINAYQAAREIFIRFGLVGYALMARHQVASTNLYLGNVQTAEGELRQLITAYQEIGDAEGEYTAELDLTNVSMSQQDFAEATQRIETLLEKLQATELSYLINHALVIATKCNLMLGQTEQAEAHFNQLQGDWQDVRPAFALIPAHLLHDRGDLTGALDKANEIKTSLASQWTPAHQEILEQIRQSAESGIPQKLQY